MFKRIGFILILISFFTIIPNIKASPLALITKILSKSYDDISRAGGRLTARKSTAHIVAHWSENASKHIHGVFSVTKEVIQGQFLEKNISELIGKELN